MTITIKKERSGREIKNMVNLISGINLDVCLQCKRCGNGCPVAPHAQCSPHEIVKRLQLGAGYELLDSDIIWACVSCGTCFARCPMKIDMSSVMDALRMLAEEKGAARPAGNIPLMNSILLRTVKMFGRTYDLGAMIIYKIGTASYLRDAAKFPMILRKGKIALLPPRGADRKKVKRIFKILNDGRGKRT
jgi:heterodisulfide reductase subunit C